MSCTTGHSAQQEWPSILRTRPATSGGDMFHNSRNSAPSLSPIYLDYYKPAVCNNSSRNFPSLFPRKRGKSREVHYLSLSILRLGKGAMNKQYLRTWSARFFMPVILGGWDNIQTSFQNLMCLSLAPMLHMNSMRLCSIHYFVASAYSLLIFINFYLFY